MGRPPIGNQAMSAAERQRRHRALKPEPSKRPPEPQATPGPDAAAEITALKAEIAALKNELAQAKARIAELQQESIGLRFAPKPRATKVEKPPLPPDEERDRQITSLKTRVRNLTAELRAMRMWQEEKSRTSGAMPFATMTAIAKCLHPDHKPSEEQRAAACKLFTAWKADKDKAARRSRR